MTRKEILAVMKEKELERDFNTHIDDINFDGMIPIDENYDYTEKKFGTRLLRLFQRTFIVKPYADYHKKYTLMGTVEGKENAISGAAIVTCNHVNKFDCFLIMRSFKKKHIHFTAAPFNNQKGFFGQMMRVGGLMPIPDKISAMKNFNSAFDEFVRRGDYIVFYPEQAMWWNYKKPRPLKNGAFHYAVKYNLPIQPMFITFIESGKTDDEGLICPKFVLNVLSPIYPKKEYTKQENIEYLKNENFRLWKETYENFYKKELKYDER